MLRVAIVALAAFLLTAAPAAAQCSLTVTTTDDAGDGSLRHALTEANVAADADVICFDIPGDGPHTIRPTSPLPAVTEPVAIDGYTQPGASENTLEVGTDAVLMVELDGDEAGEGVSGLVIVGDGITVRGLVINRFDQDGITVLGGSGNLIEGNFIGTDSSGSTAEENGDDGVSFDLGASDNVLQGNLVSGNDDDGIDFKDPETTGNVIRDNLIGTNAAGTAAIPNEDDGVDLDSGAGDNLFLGNVISGNGDNGIDLQDPGTTGNVFQGNLIGTDATGTAPLGNQDEGVDIENDVRDTLFGGIEPGEGNVIAFNGGNGIEIEDSGSGANAVLGNAIYGNGLLGIDLDSDGPTANDPGDGDGGPNNLQNTPEIRSSHIDGAGDLLVAYLVDSEPVHSAYPLRAEFFLSGADGQQGQVVLGFDAYSEADWSGCGGAPCIKTANLGSAAVLGVGDGDPLLATATDAEGNTSEFAVTAFYVANEDGATTPPDAPSLHAPYPNPTVGIATLAFDLAEAGPVRLVVYDVLGRTVAVLVDDERAAGRYEAVLDGRGMAAGLYLVRLHAGSFATTRRVVLSR